VAFRLDESRPATGLRHRSSRPAVPGKRFKGLCAKLAKAKSCSIRSGGRT